MSIKKKMKKLRVGVYCRVSTNKEDQANSLENQRLFFEEYIEKNEGWQLAEVYYDEGISGTSTKNRDGFNQMIMDAKKGKLDLIVTKEVSRFARNTVDTLEITRELKKKHIGVYFLIDNINTLDSDGELRLSLMASLAQDESRKTSERVKFGQRRQMQKGVVFGRDLLGYTVKNGVLSINDDEVETVKMIFNKFALEKKGTHVIARELEEANIPSKSGKPWNNICILRILRNEKYVGDLLQKKTFTPDYLDHQKRKNNGEEEQVFISNHHEPIISRELWDLTQKELERRKPSEETRRKHSNRYWSSGKVVCGECGSPYVIARKKLKDGSTYKAFVCGENKQHGRRRELKGETIGCDSTFIREECLISCIEECLRHIKVDTKEIESTILKEIQTALDEISSQNIDTINQQIEMIRSKKAKAFDSYLENIVDKETYHATIALYDKQLSTLYQKVDMYNCKKIECDQRIERLRVIEQKIHSILTFETVTEELLNEIVEKITIYKSRKIRIKFTFLPLEFEVDMDTAGRGSTFRTIITSLKINNL